MSDSYVKFDKHQIAELKKQLPETSPLWQKRGRNESRLKVSKIELNQLVKIQGHEILNKYLNSALMDENTPVSASLAAVNIPQPADSAQTVAETNADTMSTPDTGVVSSILLSEKIEMQKENKEASQESKEASVADIVENNTVDNAKPVAANVEGQNGNYERTKPGADSKVTTVSGTSSINSHKNNSITYSPNYKDGNKNIQVTSYGTSNGKSNGNTANKGNDQSIGLTQKKPIKSPISKPEGNETEWHNVAQAVAGKAHNKFYPSIPCQDSAVSIISPRPAVIIADGAGSAKLSHFGASAVTEGLSSLLVSLEGINKLMLDGEKRMLDDKLYVSLWLKHAAESIKRLAIILNNPFTELRSTLLLVIVGKRSIFWLRVGDGSIVLEKNGELFQPCPPLKGEHANETTFLSESISSSDFRYGFIDATSVTGVLACSDGAAERMISNDGTRVAPSIKKMFEDLRCSMLTPHHLFGFLNNEDLWMGTSGDDKSISMVSYGAGKGRGIL